MSDESANTPTKPVLPLATPEEARKGWAAFESLKTALLTDEDYQKISGKAFIKRSGFRKIAVYFGLSDRLLEAERKDREDGSFTWRIMVEARAPNGRTSVGVGVCDSAERKFSHAEHDVYATAHTRAKSRAISDMVAGGAVSAEEMEAQPEEKPEPRELGVSDTLTRVGVDPHLVEIQRVAGQTIVKPSPSLVDWPTATIALKVIGYTWDVGAKVWRKGGGGNVQADQKY